MQPFLRVKIKSLASEARIIRHEELKYKPRITKRDDSTYFELRNHRLQIRCDARSALLAYGLLRGRTYKQLEAKCYANANWTQVRDNLTRFGAGLGNKEETLRVVMDWRDGKYQTQFIRKAAA